MEKQKQLTKEENEAKERLEKSPLRQFFNQATDSVIYFDLSLESSHLQGIDAI